MSWVVASRLARRVREELQVRAGWGRRERLAELKAWAGRGGRRALIVSGCPGASRLYRAVHAALALEMLGFDVVLFEALDLRTLGAGLREFLPGLELLLCQRLRFNSEVSALLESCGGVRRVFESDDLFGLNERRSELAAVMPESRRREMAATLERCDAALASSELIAEFMAGPGREALVLGNAVSSEMIRRGAAAVNETARNKSPSLLYASGTPTHDADLELIAGPIAAALRAEPGWRLRLIGPVRVPRALSSYKNQIERVPFQSWAELPRSLAQSAINLVPLRADAFNDAKSPVKFFEAGLVALPSLVSPRRGFLELLGERPPGLVYCDSAESWEDALLSLMRDEERRRGMGAAACTEVVENHRIENRLEIWRKIGKR